jgi:hypothetical protein
MLAPQVRADIGPPPKIVELAQEGQEVTVELRFVHPGGEPGMGTEFDLTRTGPEGELLVFENQAFDPAEAASREPFCHLSDEWGELGSTQYCETYPDDCTDCDEDELPECPVGQPGFLADCAEHLFYEIVDECVPPGQTTYVLAPLSSYWPSEGTKSLEVVESGEECEAADEDDGGSDSGSGCSVAGVGAGSGAATTAIALLMGLLGGVALRQGRNRG